MAFNRTYSTFRTRQTVVQEQSKEAVIGFEDASDLPDGWEYDKKRWCSPWDLRLPSLPRLENPSYQGLKTEEYFKCGVGDVDLNDLKVKSIVETIINSDNKWIPIVQDGVYYRFNKDYFYYGDESVVEYINPADNRDSRNYIELTHTPETTVPILAATFKRDLISKEIVYKTKVAQQYKFSGLYSSGEELTTVTDAGRIYWNNVDTTKREFIVDTTIDGTTRLFFNRNYVERVGQIPSSYSDLVMCEYLGSTGASAHQIEYDNDIYIYTLSFYLEHFPVLLNGFHLYVISNTGYQEWTRVDSWWDLVTSSLGNRYYVDKDLGIVYFGSSDQNNLPRANRDIAVTYNTTLRLEYMEQDKNRTILADKADVSPITQSLNQGFICITHENLDPYNITLAINKPRINNTSDPVLYGPVTLGSDHAVLTATVTSYSGTPVPNVPVTFTMDPMIGHLSGSDTGYGITNKYGEAYSVYQPPVSTEDFGYYSTLVRNSTSPSYPTDKEVVISTTDSLGWAGEEEKVYIYQVLKDDIILGYKTVDDFLLEVYQAESPAWVVDATTYAKWKEEMIYKYSLKDFQTEPIPSGQKINGRKVVIYQISGSDNYDATAINPVTGLNGAVVPVRPLAIERDSSNYWRIVYSSGALADCGATEDIAGYWLVSTRIITFQAYCWSNYFNSYIYSNKINARLSLPEYMLGEYINSLNKKVPFGWKIPSSTEGVAGALDGATFITINPYKGPYPVIDLVDGTGETGDWADAPFRTVGFQFRTSS